MMTRQDRTVVRFVARIAKPHAARLLLSVFFGLGFAGLNAAFFYALRPVLQQLLEPGRPVWPLVALLLGFYGLRGILFIASEYLAIAAIQDMVVALRRKFLRSSLLGFYQRDLRGEQIDKCFEDINQMCGMVKLISANLIKDLFTVLALVAVLMLFSPPLALFITLFYAFSVLPLRYLGSRLRKLAKQQRDVHSRLMARILELLTIRLELYGPDMDPLAVGQLGDDLEKNARSQKQLSLMDRSVPMLMEFLAVLGFILLIALYGQTMVEELSLSGTMAFAAASLAMYSPAKNLAGFHMGLQRALVAAHRVVPYLEQTLEFNRFPEPVRHISVFISRCSGEKNRLLLRDIHLELKHGTCLAVTGANGAGKTTLLHCIAGFRAFEGHIAVNHVVIAKDGGRPGPLFFFAGVQPALFDDTLAANISCHREARIAELEELVEIVGLWKPLRDAGLSLHSHIGEVGQRLSQGMRQRLVLARALFFRPQVLLLDEVFSSIEPNETVPLFQRLRKHLPDTIMLVVTNDKKLLAVIQRVLFMHRGTVAALGSHRELLNEWSEYQTFLQQSDATDRLPYAYSPDA